MPTSDNAVLIIAGSLTLRSIQNFSFVNKTVSMKDLPWESRLIATFITGFLTSDSTQYTKNN